MSAQNTYLKLRVSVRQTTQWKQREKKVNYISACQPFFWDSKQKLSELKIPEYYVQFRNANCLLGWVKSLLDSYFFILSWMTYIGNTNQKPANSVLLSYWFSSATEYFFGPPVRQVGLVSENDAYYCPLQFVTVIKHSNQSANKSSNMSVRTLMTSQLTKCSCWRTCVLFSCCLRCNSEAYSTTQHSHWKPTLHLACFPFPGCISHILPKVISILPYYFLKYLESLSFYYFHTCNILAFL